jgi:pantoate--beta-alanine ligase
VSMRLVSTRSELAEALSEARGAGPVGFVPTMGALHPGHARVMSVARDRLGGGSLVVSIFVNPSQFGTAADLARYPRTLDTDVDLCRTEGVDVVFAPGVDEIYPTDSYSAEIPSGGQPEGAIAASPVAPVTVDPGPAGDVLEGASRPGHFRGVLTVVAKLFGLVRPDVAAFGEKDFQQLVLIRRMVAELNLGIDIVGAPTLREPDGLAMSSRNRFLTADQRAQAGILHQALHEACEVARAGRGLSAARSAAKAKIAASPEIALDYLAFRDAALNPLSADRAAGMVGRVLVAGRLGTVRLIDNCRIEFAAD